MEQVTDGTIAVGDGCEKSVNLPTASDDDDGG
jgi:hypothetical protein